MSPSLINDPCYFILHHSTVLRVYLVSKRSVKLDIDLNKTFYHKVKPVQYDASVVIYGGKICM